MIIVEVDENGNSQEVVYCLQGDPHPEKVMYCLGPVFKNLEERAVDDDAKAILVELFTGQEEQNRDCFVFLQDVNPNDKKNSKGLSKRYVTTNRPNLEFCTPVTPRDQFCFGKTYVTDFS